MRTETAAVEDSVPGKARVGNYYFLPRGRVRVVGEPQNEGGYKITISRFNVPDVGSRYFLKQNFNAFFDDHTVLEVDDQGLLATVNVTSEDKTSEIIDKVTETVISVAKIAANVSGGLAPRSAAMGADAEPFVPKPFNCTFDPLKPAEVRAAQAGVDNAGFALTVGNGGDSPAAAGPVREKLSRDGVYHRPPRLVHVTITAGKAAGTAVLERTTVRVPDPDQIAVLSLSRPFLVKKTTNLEFAAGDLKKVDFSKPSEALALVSIPASVAAKVAEAIPSIIEVRDARANAGLTAEKARLDARKAAIDSELALRASRKALEESDAAGGARESFAQEPTSFKPAFLTLKEKKARAEAAELEADSAGKIARNAIQRAAIEETRINVEKLKAEAELVEAESRKKAAQQGQ